MDDSWRMLIGMTNDHKQKQTLPRRRSTEDRSVASGLLGPEDFTDVFGGPPRTVLSRQFSTTSSNLYNEEIFRPSRNNRFYSDIFTKSNLSTVWSSEESTPLRQVAGDGSSDGSFSTFSSKLRPINMPNRWSSSVMLNEEQQWQQGPEFSTHHSSNLDSLFTEINFIDNFKSFHKRVSQRCSSRETNNLENTLYDVSLDDQELNSPTAVVYQKSQYRALSVEDEVMQEHGNEDEFMSSYVIEIDGNNREEVEEEVIDEAVAWAKGKFCSERVWSNNKENEYVAERGFSGRQMDEDGIIRSRMDKEQIELDTEELLEIDMKMELLDNNIAKWASDKEASIRLLLSTLHQILWLNSGWSPVLLKNLIDNSQVRKAYRKARLCLHPDKLQQRGATLLQKHIASKVFSIIQDAWDAYISQDVLFMS